MVSDGGNDDNNCHGDEGGDTQDDDIDGDDNKNDSWDNLGHDLFGEFSGNLMVILYLNFWIF